MPYKKTPGGRNGKIAQKVSDNGRVSIYQDGRVLYQPTGVPHSLYAKHIAKPVDLSVLTRKPT